MSLTMDVFEQTFFFLPCFVCLSWNTFPLSELLCERADLFLCNSFENVLLLLRSAIENLYRGHASHFNLCQDLQWLGSTATAFWGIVYLVRS